MVRNALSQIHMPVFIVLFSAVCGCVAPFYPFLFFCIVALPLLRVFFSPFSCSSLFLMIKEKFCKNRNNCHPNQQKVENVISSHSAFCKRASAYLFLSRTYSPVQTSPFPVPVSLALPARSQAQVQAQAQPQPKDALRKLASAQKTHSAYHRQQPA
jgi:hypothetical protein